MYFLFLLICTVYKLFFIFYFAKLQILKKKAALQLSSIISSRFHQRETASQQRWHSNTSIPMIRTRLLVHTEERYRVSSRFRGWLWWLPMCSQFLNYQFFIMIERIRKNMCAFGEIVFISILSILFVVRVCRHKKAVLYSSNHSYIHLLRVSYSSGWCHHQVVQTSSLGSPGLIHLSTPIYPKH